MILTLVQAFIFLSYIIFLMIRFKGPLPSISESWYKLGYPGDILFTLFCWILGFTMAFRGDISSLFFFSGAGLLFVGAATMFKNKITSTVHFIGAGSGIIFALLGILSAYGNPYPIIGWVIITLLIYLLKVKNHMWWIEIAAFLGVIIGLFIS